MCHQLPSIHQYEVLRKAILPLAQLIYLQNVAVYSARDVVELLYIDWAVQTIDENKSHMLILYLLLN